MSSSAGRPGRRALDVLAFVVRFKEEHCGDSPSMAEIAAGVGLASKSTVFLHLAALEDHGLITRPSRGDARRIAVAGGVWRWQRLPAEQCDR